MLQQFECGLSYQNGFSKFVNTDCFRCKSFHMQVEFISWVHFHHSYGEWLWSLENIKGTNKDTKIYVGRSTTVQNLLFCIHTLCMSYVIKTILLVSFPVSTKQLLCFVHGQGQKRHQTHTTKNFVKFQNYNHSPQLTMLSLDETCFHPNGS